MIHKLPVSQALAFSACSAWASGMEAKNGGYTDREIDRAVAQIKEEELTSED